MQILVAGDERLVIVRRVEEAARSLSVNRAIRSSARSMAVVDKSRLERRLIDVDQRVDQAGIVVEIGVERRPAVLVDVQQLPVGRPQAF